MIAAAGRSGTVAESGFCQNQCAQTNSWSQKQGFSRELTVERDMVVAVANHEDRVGRLVPLEGGLFGRGAVRGRLGQNEKWAIDPGILLTRRRSLL